MANIIKTKFSAVTSTPSSLAVGELAYSDASDTLFIGDNTGTPVAIGGAASFTKLAGIEAGAEVNDVDSVAGKTGAVTLVMADITDYTTVLAAYLPLTGGTLSGFLTAHANPTSAFHVATKQYVDNYALGLDFKQSVRAASTANVDISTGLENGDTLDGVTLATGDRVLLKNQTTTSQNGIYVVVASGAGTRAPDADTSAELTKGAFAYVEEGTVNGGAAFVATAAGTLGTDPVTFTQFGGGQTYSAGTGLTLTGTVFSVTNHANILFNDDEIDGGTF